MKSMLVYSSRTGNTKKVAESLRAVMPAEADFYSVEQAPDPGGHDLLILGFWIDKGRPDKLMRDYFQRVHGRQVVFFFTLGDYPEGSPAARVAADTQNLLKENNNQVLGYFPCQGKVNPDFLEGLKRTHPSGHPPALIKARVEEAAKHPNDDELRRAKEFIKSLYRDI
jgi:flavodoxin